MNKKQLNDLLDKRDERTKKRKEIKKKMDSIIGLSYHDEDKNVITLSATIAPIADNTARLLDEGYCDNGFVIKKGALEKYLNGENEYVTGYEYIDGTWKRTDVLNLTDDFTGTVNLGHQDFATHPFILGEFNKNDLTLVDGEEGRKALNVGVRLDEDSMYVKELRRQPYDIGVSAEFWYHVDWESTESLYETYGMWMPVIDEIFIFAYALVGECGNVNSSGLKLKGEVKMPENIENMVLDEMELDAEHEVEIEPTSEAEPTEETPAEPETDIEEGITEEEHQGESEEAEAEEAEDGEEPDGDEGEDEEADELAEVLATVKDLKGQVETLSNTIRSLEETNASLKKTNRKLSGKLQRENERKREFLDGVKGLSVQLFPYEDKEAETKSKKESSVTKGYYEDGIGEL